MTENTSKDKTQPFRRIAIWLSIFAVACLSVALVLWAKNLFYFRADIYLFMAGLVFSVIAIFFWSFANHNAVKPLLPVAEKVLKFIEGPLLALIFIFSCLAILEITLRLMHKNQEMANFEKITDNSVALWLNSPAYQNVSYQTPAFFNEIVDTYHGIGAGNYISFDGNLRKTAYQPENYVNTVYIFGGSTVYCFEVPDEYTLPSQMQLAFNRQFGEHYKVVNMGKSAIGVAEQWERLQKVNLIQGDIVIWFDGYNEIRNTQRIEAYTPQNLLERSMIYRKLISPIITRGLPNSFKNTGEQAYQNIMAYVPLAAAYAKAHDAAFFHFIQPSLYTLNAPNAYESALLQNYAQNYQGWLKLFTHGYERLLEANQNLADQGIFSVDLTDALDHHQRTHTNELFIDDIHVNHYGNEMLASAMMLHLADIIEESLVNQEIVDNFHPIY